MRSALTHLVSVAGVPAAHAGSARGEGARAVHRFEPKYVDTLIETYKGSKKPYAGD
jgi:hypothetical protein